MFDQIFGLPVHVLVNHAVVVFVPLTVAVAVVYAVVPRWRWYVRWPLVVGAAVCLVSAYVAKESGQDFYDRLNQPQIANEHRDRAYLLFWILLVFFAVSVLAAVLLGGRSPLAGGHDRRGASKVVQLVVAIVLVIVAVVAGVQVALTGDAGARAVWGPAQ